MAEHDTVGRDDPVSPDDLKSALNDSEDRSLEFWKSLLAEGKDSFQTEVDEILEIRTTSIEMIKIVLLLGSFYVALYQYGFTDETFAIDRSIIVAPFLLLLFSMVIFTHTYFIVGHYTLGPHSGNAYTTLKDGYEEKEYHKIMSLVYFKWGDDNMEVIQKANRRLTMGLSGIFSSLGVLAALLLFY